MEQEYCLSARWHTRMLLHKHTAIHPID